MHEMIQLKAMILAACTADPPPKEEEVRNNFLQEQDLFNTALAALQEEGQLVKTRKGRLAHPSSMGLHAGRIQGNARGFAFFIPDDGSLDAFISADDLGGALHGDRVFARVQGETRVSGEVDRILRRANDVVIGSYSMQGASGYVQADDKRISMGFRVAIGQENGAIDGDKVVFRVSRWADQGGTPEGIIVEILGHSGDRNADLLAIVRSHGLDEEFSSATLAAAEGLPAEVTPKEIEGREDLREQPCVTIDGATAKDFDDAVYAQRIDGGYRLFVHIADVTHYVRERGPIERDAFERGTSVYLLDRVLPMLPEALSNGICSLNPNVDRLAFSCIMDIDGKSGDVLSYKLSRTVIRSGARLIYEDVTAYLEGNAEQMEKLKEQGDTLRTMYDLQNVLAARRARRGAIDFDIAEADIHLDADGKPTAIDIAQRGIANRMIEEFMLMANETVATHAISLELPFLYRVHEDPDTQKIRDFAAFVTNLGYKLKIGKKGIQPKDLQSLLTMVKGQKEEGMVSRLMLRSLQRARYDIRNLGHFGLALTDYCHFTSPIRRYPDLFIHRVLKKQLKGKLDMSELTALSARAEAAAKQASERERAAMEAERDVDNMKKAEFMLAYVGASFDGVISGVSNAGFFVELPNTIEGLVSMRTLEDDHYVFLEKEYRLEGRRKQRSFRLGDAVRVVCSRVDMQTRRVDFELEDENA